MDILVTGGAGFIGCHLARFYAEQKHNITIVDNLYRGMMDDDLQRLVHKSNVEFMNMDLTKGINNLEHSYDMVFHLAGVNGTSTFYTDPYFTSKTNLLSLINVIDWVKKYSKSCRFIWTSSSETYASVSHKMIPTGEDVMVGICDIYNPRWSYASSKIAGESMVLNCGLDSVVVRPHNVYGPRMGFGHVISDYIKKLRCIKKGVMDCLVIEGTGSDTRSFCYIDDFVDGFDKIAMQGETCEVYNIGSGMEEVTMMSLARKLMNIFNVDCSIQKSESREGSTKRRCADISKLRKLGFSPKTCLDGGLVKTVRWYTK